MEKLKQKFSQVKEWTKAHKKEIIITLSAATGVALTYVGYKHYKGGATGVNVEGDEILNILSDMPEPNLTPEEIEVFNELVEKM